MYSKEPPKAGDIVRDAAGDTRTVKKVIPQEEDHLLEFTDGDSAYWKGSDIELISRSESFEHTVDRLKDRFGAPK